MTKKLFFLVKDHCEYQDCSIRLEDYQSEGQRRLAGSSSDQCQLAADLPPPPQPPPLREVNFSLNKGLELPISIKSPPAHGPLSPVRKQPDISETEVLSSRTSSESSSKSYSSWDTWDNYHERSSYELGDQAFWDNKRDSRKIQIVSTDISDLSSFSGSEFSFPNSLLDIQNMAPSEACKTAAKELSRANSVLQARVFMLDVGDIDSSYLHRVPEELNAIRDLLTDFIVKVNEFLLEFQSELDPSVVTT